MASTARDRIRAAVYVVRGEGTGQEVLVFDHVHHPEAGTQVPGGGVDPGETLDAAARREVLEETGLVLTGRLTALGAKPTPSGASGSGDISVFFAGRTDEARHSWEHAVTGGTGSPAPGADTGLLFRCYFVPLSRARAARDSYHFSFAHLLQG